MRNISRAAALLLSLTLASCSAAPAPYADADTAPAPSSPSSSSAAPADNSPADESSDGSPSGRYRLYLGEDTVWFDSDGRLLPDEGDGSTVICHTETGEPLYLIRTRVEDTGADDQYGQPIAEHLSALYGADGKLLHDYEPIIYEPGAGRLLIRRSYVNMFMGPMPGDEIDTALWDPSTGKAVIEGVMSVQKIEDDAYMALGPEGELLGVINSGGNKLSGFPAPLSCYYPSCGKGFIAGEARNPDGSGRGRCIVLDKELDLLFEGSGYIDVSDYYIKGPYMMYEIKNGVRQIVSLETFEVLYEYGPHTERVEYFDGERMIIRTGEGSLAGYILCDADGNHLTTLYDRIDHGRYLDSKDPAEYFIARAHDTAYLLDRDGKALKSVTIPGATDFAIEEGGMFTYTIGGMTDGTYYLHHSQGLLDAGLNIIIPAGRYFSIQRAANHDYHGSEYFDAWLGTKQERELYRRDLLGLDGSLLIENLSQTGTITADRICVIRGFSMGLMDWHGNWITRYPVYDSLGLVD